MSTNRFLLVLGATVCAIEGHIQLQLTLLSFGSNCLNSSSRWAFRNPTSAHFRRALHSFVRRSRTLTLSHLAALYSSQSTILRQKRRAVSSLAPFSPRFHIVCLAQTLSFSLPPIPSRLIVLRRVDAAEDRFRSILYQSYRSFRSEYYPPILKLPDFPLDCFDLDWTIPGQRLISVWTNDWLFGPSLTGTYQDGPPLAEAALGEAARFWTRYGFSGKVVYSSP